MQRAIRRLGFAAENLGDGIAQTMYQNLRWEDSIHVLQYVAVGRRLNYDLEQRFPQLKQITWEQISDFLFKRFSDFPPKLRSGGRVHDQWPDFGKKYGRWFQEMGHRERSIDAVQRYIDVGQCLPRRQPRGPH